MGCGNQCHDILCFDDKEHWCHEPGCTYVEPTREQVAARNKRPWDAAPKVKRERKPWPGFSLAFTIDGQWAGFHLINLSHIKVITLGWVALQFFTPSVDTIIADQQRQLEHRAHEPNQLVACKHCGTSNTYWDKFPCVKEKL